MDVNAVKMYLHVTTALGTRQQWNSVDCMGGINVAGVTVQTLPHENLSVEGTVRSK